MKVFVDFDDTLARSCETIVEMINKTHGTNKTIKDIVDYGFRSIHERITDEEIDSMFKSDEFFENVKLFDGAIETLLQHEVYLCTCGSKENLKKKREFVDKNNLGYKVLGVVLNGENSAKNKSMYDMSGSVQIDDNYNALKYTNASVKILFKNFNNYEWQRVESNDNIYIVDTWMEIKEILDWLVDNEDYC